MTGQTKNSSGWYDEENAPNLMSRRGVFRGAAGAVGGAAALAAVAPSAAWANDDGTSRVSIPEYDALVRDLVAGRTLKVGFTPPILSEFFNQMEHACFRQAHEYTERFGVNWEWDRASPAGNFDAVEEHFDIIQNWVTAGFDAIFICTAGDFQSMQKVYADARAKGVTIIQFNMPMELYPIEEVRSDSAVSYNNVTQSGYLAGRYLVEQLGGAGKIIQIWGPSGSPWAEAREIGFQMAIADHPDIEVVGKADGGYVRDKGMAAAQNLLTANPDVDAIYGENEEMALGASLAISSLGMQNWDGDAGIITIGADGLRSGFEEIRQGRLSATIDVAGVDQGLGLVQTLFAHRVLGQAVDAVNNQPTVVVDKSNVEIADAYIAWALGAEAL